MKSFLAIVLGVVLLPAVSVRVTAGVSVVSHGGQGAGATDPSSSASSSETQRQNKLTVPSDIIDELPDNALLHVFSFVGADDWLRALVGPMSRVCRRWRDLLRAPETWESADLVVNLVPPEDADGDADIQGARRAGRILELAPALSLLWLREPFFRPDTDARLLTPALATSNVAVKNMVVVDSGTWAKLGPEGRTALLELLRRSAGNLRRLTLGGLDSPSEGIAIATDAQGGSALRVLAALQNLEQLNLNDLNPSQAYDGELEGVKFRKLHDLSISERESIANSNKEFHVALIKAVAPTVCSLKLDFEPSDSEDLQEALKSCKKLQSLQIRHPGPLSTLSACTEINDLWVEFWEMKAEQVKEVLTICRSMKNLRILSLVAMGNDPGDVELTAVERHVNEFKKARPIADVAFLDLSFTPDILDEDGE